MINPSPESACTMSLKPRPAARRTPLAIALAAALLAGHAAGATSAQLADLSLEDLMRIEVVSASRKTQHLAEVPAAMHVITADDIRSSGARNLPEALRLVPGLDVAQLSGSRWGISTRGFTGRYANKLLVLVDGRSVYSPLYSGVIWEAERVPLDTIERIEVLHGPAGSVWGSNAVNGVINIITKEAGETPGKLVDVAIGDGGRRMLRARHGAEAGEGSAWRIGAMADQGSAGRDVAGGDANDSNRQAMADARWDRRWSADAHSTLEAQVLRSKSDELQEEALYVPPYLQPLPLRLAVDRALLAARHEQRVSAELTTNLRAAFTAETVRFGDRVDLRTRVLDLEAGALWQAASGHELSLGAGLRHMDLPTRPTDWMQFDPEQRRGIEWSLYAQDEWTLVPSHWRLTAGARVDHDIYRGSHLQPNLRLLFSPATDLALWGGLSRANRTVSRGESDSLVKISVIPPGTPDNPGTLPIELLAGGAQDPNLLDNRYTDAFELGVRAQGGGVWSFDLTAFAHRMRDDIGASRIGGVPTFVALPQPHLEVNTVGAPYTVHLRGVEAAAEWRPASGWRHQFGASYLDVRGPGDASATGLDRLMYATPRWLAHWRSVIDLAPDWRLDARVRHAGERGAPDVPAQHVAAYTALDATLTWCAGKSTEFQLGGTNLLRPPTVEFQPDLMLAAATRIERRVFLRWRQSF